MRPFPSHSVSQLGQSRTVFQSSFSRRSQRSVGESLSADMLNTPSFVFTKGSSQVACWFVTSLLSSSKSRLGSVRISLMIWCVPARNESSTWNTSDTRFVVCVHRPVSSMFGTNRTAQDGSCQHLGAHLRPKRLSCSFPDHCSLVGSSGSGCHSGGGFADTTSPPFMCDLRF